MMLAYAVIPHEWITFSDKYLQWDTTVFVFRSNQKMLFFPWNWPFNFDKHNIRDIIVVLIYGIAHGPQRRAVRHVAEARRGQGSCRPRRRRRSRASAVRCRRREAATAGASANGGEA